MLLVSIVTQKKGGIDKCPGTGSLASTAPGVPDEKQVRETTELREAQGIGPAKPLPICPFPPLFITQKCTLG